MSEIIDIYKDILDMPDILGAVCKYIAQSKCGFQYDFGHTIIPKGTVLYRIRKSNESTDFSDKKEWQPAPHKPQNRCNHAGETALYLGSTGTVCLLETDIKQGETFVIGKYQVIKDIPVGGFIYLSPNESNWKIIAGMLLNAFLIAPSRNEKNTDAFSVLDSIFDDMDYSNIRLKDFNDPKLELAMPYRIGMINKKDKYYEITNTLCDILKSRYPKGIRYSSCWIPAETVGIECSEYNIVLYEAGLDSIQFIEYEIKINTSKVSQKDITECLLHTRKGSKYYDC